MTELTNKATGHTVRTDEESAEFWQAAGYSAVDPEPERKKSTRKASSSKSNK